MPIVHDLSKVLLNHADQIQEIEDKGIVCAGSMQRVLMGDNINTKTLEKIAAAVGYDVVLVKKELVE